MRAHRLGEDINRHVGCYWTEDEYELSCPIFALHRNVAVSIARTLDGACSICGAGPFSCEHAPGEYYAGEFCQLLYGGVLGTFDHVALTTNPDFISNWHQAETESVSQLKASGKIARVGDPLQCRHCCHCSGLDSASEGDLDPAKRWDDLMAETPSSEAHLPPSPGAIPVMRAHTPKAR